MVHGGDREHQDIRADLGDDGAGMVKGVNEASIPSGLRVGGAEPAGTRVKPRALEGEGGTGGRLRGAGCVAPLVKKTTNVATVESR